MCCFTAQVARVLNTRIFARATAEDHQALVYAMSLAAPRDVAMVLPLPVPPRSPEDAVRFVSLEHYPSLFTDMQRAFPLPARTRKKAQGARRGGAIRGAALRVQDVGDYEASFVPTVDDFDRLDPRFVLPRQTWDRLGDYRDWGFAVFTLKGFSPAAPPRGLLGRTLDRMLGRAAVAEHTDALDDDLAFAPLRAFHPMALVFPRRDLERLYFPTVHIHDGVVHRSAHFDHTLYLQGSPRIARWRRSTRAAKHYLDLRNRDDICELVDPDTALRQRRIHGNHPNRDVWIEMAR